MQDRELMRQALDALNSIDVGYRTQYGDHPEEVSFNEELCNKTIEALRARLAQPESGLPPLPDAFDWHKQPMTGWYGKVYTEEQMQEYAAEALRARLAQPKVENLGEIVPADEEQLKRIEKLVSLEPKPVAWMYDFPNPDNPNELIRDWVAHSTEEVEKNNGVNVRPLYLHRQCEWINLTDEEIRNAFAPIVKQYFNPQHGAHSFDVLGVGGASMVLHLSRAIEAQLKQKNHSGDCAEMVKKKWQGLSTAETKVLWNLTKKPSEYAQAIEAKLKERNA